MIRPTTTKQSKAQRSPKKAYIGRTKHRRQVRGMQLVRDAAHTLLQGRQAVKDERETRKRTACSGNPAAPNKLGEGADEDHRQRVRRKGYSDTDQCHKPAGAGRAHIGAEHEAESLRKRK